jgi:hypothetical protein
MRTATPGPASVVTLAAFVATLVSGPLCADEAPSNGAGVVVTIPVSLTTDATSRLETRVRVLLKRFKDEQAHEPNRRGPFYVICDFNPDGKTSASEDFYACLKLADFLRELPEQEKGVGVETVAFVHGDVRRHSVLPVLACARLHMPSDPQGLTHLGPVTDREHPLRDVELTAYAKASPRHLFPQVLIRKMYDARLRVLKVAVGQPGDPYVDADAKPAPRGELVADLGANVTAQYTAARARELGICESEPLDSVNEVRLKYQLPRTSLVAPLDHVVAVRILVGGEVNGELREKVQRLVHQALGQNANLILLQLSCVNGDPLVAHDLGLYLSSLNDNRPERPVQTVAFLTKEARNTAVFLALGCDLIVMESETVKDGTVIKEGARLGDFEPLVLDNPNLRAELADKLGSLAAKHNVPSLLARCLVDPDLVVYAVRAVKGNRLPTYMTEKELEDDQKGEQVWARHGGPIKAKGTLLTLSAQKAKRYEIADYTAGSFEDVCKQVGVREADVYTIKGDWLESLANFLRNPTTSLVLVIVGLICMILELKMPGVVAPGCIAAICFVLFFWSQSQLNGQIVWLAVLLFILGLLLIALEVFVIPGFGFAGVSGIVLVIVSLGLMAYGHWPRSQDQWLDLGQQIVPFGLSLLGALVGAFLLARYLPSIPYVNRLILQPAADTEEGPEEILDPAHAELVALLGAIGVAATPLRPAGKAQFGDAFVDVVAEGSYVVPGTRVQVIEIEGNRVVVKEV